MKPIPFLIGAGIIISCSLSTFAASPDIGTLKKEYVRPTEIPFPTKNPYSQTKEQLGKMLFFDPRLSRSRIMSCATCHNPSFSWGDGLPRSVGDFHKELGRRTQTVLNLAWDDLFFWDGRSESLEDQALDPIASHAEMGLPLKIMIQNLKDIKGYKPYFRAAFPEDTNPIHERNVAKAIATYERTIISAEAPFDRWITGDDNAISDEAKKGFDIFNNKGQCSSCHSGWNFSDGDFHDIGLKDNDIGRYGVLEIDNMKHAFKTPGLRNINQRSPYMHDGSVKTLMDVVNHYNDGFVRRDSLSPHIKKLDLTDSEKKSLIAFMKALTSKDPEVTFPILPR